MTLGERLCYLRKTSGLSHEIIAEEVGVPIELVKSWENDQSIPTTESLILLSNLFQVSLDELINLIPKEVENDNIITIQDEITSSNSEIFQLEYSVTKETLILPRDTPYPEWYFVVYFSIFSHLILRGFYFIFSDPKTGIIYCSIFILFISVLTVIIIQNEKNQIKKALNQKIRVKLTFYNKYIHVDKVGYGIETSYDVSYNKVYCLIEKSNYFLLYLYRRRPLYLPKQENKERLSLILRQNIKRIYIRTDSYYNNKRSLYSRVCFILSTLSIISLLLSINFLNSAHDVWLWFLLIIFPVATLITSLLVKKHAYKKYWIFSMVIGIITIFLELMGLIAITNP